MIFLRFSNYARIGKSPLIKAIGIQKNHIDTYYTESQELDRAASGCFSCPNYKNIEFLEYLPQETQSDALFQCNHCSQCVYKTVYKEHIRYINEKNRFGSAKRLKGIALKLFVIYHFCNPDDHGLIKSLSPKELAAYLGCTVRSIYNANAKLQEYGYIMLCKDGLTRNHFHVILAEYDTYALTAKDGGRGYATFNLPFLDELVKLDDLNQLRIYLRTALDLDTNRNPEKKLVATTPYSTLRRYLPRYCKPGIIRKALSSVSNLFHVIFSEESVTLQMKPAYHGKRVLEMNNTENATSLRSYFENLDAAMQRINDSSLKETKAKQTDIDFLNQAGIVKQQGINKKFYVPFRLTDSDYSDLALLASTYSLSAVKKCISYVYNAYKADFKLQSIGALIRTILKCEDSEIDSLPLNV